MERTEDEGGDPRPAALGGTIRALRKSLGLRQGDLAKRTGMSAAQLCHIEKDRNAPSVRTLRRIADALGVPLAQLAAGADDVPAKPRRRRESRAMEISYDEAEAPAPLFAAEEAPPLPAPARSKSGAGRSHARKALSMAGLARSFGSAAMWFGGTQPPPGPGFVDSLRPAGETSLADLPPVPREQVRRRILEYHEIEGRTGVPTRPALSLDYPSEVAAGDAEALARAVRRAAGVADAVLFDSIALLESKGIRVVMADLPEGVDAFSLWEEAARNAWIVVRKAATDERQQFRAMCALADVLRFVARGADGPSADTPAARRFAREFAAAFLMPAAALRELCYRLALDDESWSWELLLREKRRYAVSAEAFAYRLEALGLLRPSLRQDFVRRARAWFDEHGGEPEPSHRKEARHSRFSDLRELIRLRGAARR